MVRKENPSMSANLWVAAYCIVLHLENHECGYGRNNQTNESKG